MKNLEQIYKKQNRAEIIKHGDDYRIESEVIFDALVEYLAFYFHPNTPDGKYTLPNGKWTLCDAIKEVLHMGLTDKETKIAVGILVEWYDRKSSTFKKFNR